MSSPSQKIAKNEIDTLPGCILITDVQGKILYGNTSLTSKTGFSKEEILGKKPSELWGGHMSTDFYKELWGTIKGKKKPFMGEVENQRKDGAPLKENLYISPILNPAGEVEYFLELQPTLHTRGEEKKFQSEFEKIMAQQTLNAEGLMEHVLRWSSDEIAASSKQSAWILSCSNTNLPTLLELLFLSYGESARLDDAQLVESSKQNPERFAALYNKYRDRVYNYLLYRVSDDARIAEELLQETFVRAFHALDHFKPQEYTYLSYLLVIAHNLLINYYRSPKLVYMEDLSVLKTTTESRKADFLADRDLWKQLDQLGTAEKQVILMMYKEDKSVKEIAKAMHKTDNAIKLLLSRARKKLRLLHKKEKA